MRASRLTSNTDIDLRGNIKILKHPDFLATHDDEVCVFVSFSTCGSLRPSAYAYYHNMISAGIKVILCIIVNDLEKANLDPRLTDCAAVLYRQNTGWDFGAWADMLRQMPQLFNAKRIYFANDSVLCLPDSFAKMIHKIRELNEDYIALTESNEINHHTQSYFFALQNSALNSKAVINFWSNIENLPSKREVIYRYEAQFLNVIKEAGLSHHVMFSYKNLFPETNIDDIKFLNATCNLWETLIYKGFPFIKISLLTRNMLKTPIYHWSHIASEYGADVEAYASDIAKIRTHKPLIISTIIKKILRFVYQSKITYKNNKIVKVFKIFKIPVYTSISS